MRVIDSHQHFWKFDPLRDSWINNDMKAIQKDFLPADFELILRENGIDGSVVVQSDQSEAENKFQLKNAEQYDFIKGVIGWIDLQADDVEEKLINLQQYKKLKGFRHVLQSETRRDMMLQPAFKRGIGLLNKYGFTFDLLILPDQLQYAKELIAYFPEQKFVLDHIGKPEIKDREILQWQNDITALGEYKNVYCKISGMVTEANWKTWTNKDFEPYLDVIIKAFGTNRIMFGSDWPVCLVAASYQKMKDIVEDYFSSFSENEKEAFFGRNAIEFYNL